ncbi:hypothetical protein CRG98_047859 [Punica granatum]|uniref:Uncharacterized protein n=1 Tax=Punica granatum TaxID=22663 RepID=A0A2I0HJ87_PUNGR|nr:hypothetical protein CRG98_047859 [Punica granatum]
MGHPLEEGHRRPLGPPTTLSEVGWSAERSLLPRSAPPLTEPPQSRSLEAREKTCDVQIGTKVHEEVKKN